MIEPNAHRFPPLPVANDGLMVFPPPILTDPNGSYTGMPQEPMEQPVQDADDL